MDLDAKIYVAGHRGMVGSAIVRKLESQGYRNLIVRPHSVLDLTSQASVAEFFQAEMPDYVFLAAAKVGGIVANSTYPAEFARENLAIELNVVHEAWRCGVKRLLFLGSSCIYPKHAPQPLREEYLLTGPLEATNRAYAVAKIAGIEHCWSYNREFGTRFLGELAELVKDAVGYQGEIVFDSSKPDGTPVKRLDVSRLRSLGWEYNTKLVDGLRYTYEMDRSRIAAERGCDT